MSDKDVIKNILKSKVEQQLRESLTNEEKTFKVESSIHKEVLNNYNNMNEEQQNSFTSKGWKND